MTSANDLCLILATASSISFTQVNTVKKLHVQTLDLEHRSASSVTSLPDMKLLGVGCTSRTMDPETGEMLIKGFFELRDSTTLQRRFLMAEVQSIADGAS